MSITTAVVKKGMLKKAALLMVYTLGALFLLRSLVLVFIYFCDLESNAMAPNLSKGDEVIADKQVFAKEKVFRRGDIILFYPPLLELGLDKYPPNLGILTGFRFLPNTRLYCRRIIGLPGEKFAVEPGRGVLVNDAVLNEQSYLREPAFFKTTTLNEISGNNWDHKLIYPYPHSDAPIVVPANCYFVLSDDRRCGHDSQTFGFVDQSNIVGTVTWTSNRSASLRPDYNLTTNK